MESESQTMLLVSLILMSLLSLLGGSIDPVSTINDNYAANLVQLCGCEVPELRNHRVL